MVLLVSKKEFIEFTEFIDKLKVEKLECSIFQRPAEKMVIQHVMILTFCLTGHEEVYGTYDAGDVLFRTETKTMRVIFNTNSAGTLPGFTLDVRSIPCANGRY